MTLGVATYLVARKKDKILVAIPIMFGIQQFFEGIQWLYLDSGSFSLFAGYGFLLFALIVWPAYVPAFVFALDKTRKKLISVFALVGIGVAIYFALLLATVPLFIQEKLNCVYYVFEFPSREVVLPLYLIAIFGALLLSSRPIFRWFGLVIAVLALVTWKLYERNFLSVWCFFAAAVSALFFLHVQRRRARAFREVGNSPT